MRHLMFSLSSKILCSFPGFAKSPFQANSVWYNGPDVYAKSSLWLCQLVYATQKASIAASLFISSPNTTWLVHVCSKLV